MSVSRGRMLVHLARQRKPTDQQSLGKYQAIVHLLVFHEGKIAVLRLGIYPNLRRDQPVNEWYDVLHSTEPDLEVSLLMRRYKEARFSELDRGAAEHLLTRPDYAGRLREEIEKHYPVARQVS